MYCHKAAGVQAASGVGAAATKSGSSGGRPLPPGLQPASASQRRGFYPVPVMQRVNALNLEP
eukprot:8205583-Alexandrium_andersonii.AAC.1